MGSSAKASKGLFKTSTILTGALTVLAFSHPAQALPTGGNVVGGTANISSKVNRVDINQSSNRAVINWDSFDVGSKEQVNFNQPSSGAVILNRVVSSKAPSQIFGTVNANGNVMIVNSQGVLFGKGAQVNVGGLVATTADISNSDFMKGNYNFNKAGNPNAKIQNDGAINIKEGGLATLVGPNVTNNGLIQAKLGKVQLGSGDTFSVDLYGDGLINLQASKDLNKQLASNSGTIKANGGSVLITAAAAESTVNSLINMDGVIQANGVGKRNGHVVLTADNIKVSGKIDASGKKAGGTVLIGGDYQGKGKTQTAQNTVITDTAVISADATENGNGGKVIVWANDYTAFNGRISARGGAKGGNGGFVETSGKNVLSVGGSVDAGAAYGKNGSWLLDPRNMTIGNSTNALSSSGSPDVTYTPSGDSSVINHTTIENALASGTNIILQTKGSGGVNQAGDITVSSTIARTKTGTATLTLDADGAISFSNNTGISSTGGALNVVLIADDGITMGTNSFVTTNGGYVDYLSRNGNITIGNNANITTNGGTILLRSNAAAGSISLANSNSTLSSDKTGSTADGDITLVANSFSNASGVDGLQTGSARWLIYTQKPANNTLGGLTADFTRYGCSYGSCSFSNTGKGLLYSQTVGTLTATPSAITIIYGDAIPSLVNYNYSITGYNTAGDAATDVITGSLTGSTTYTPGSNIGNYNINYVSGSLSSLLGYGFTYANNATAILVNKKTITAALAGPISKIYDGSDSATLNSANYSFGGGLFGTDDVTISNTAGTYNNKNVGTGKAVTVNGLTLAGAKAGNYELASTSVTGNVGTITKRDLTISATGNNKVYDGNNNATVNLSDDRVVGDVFTTRDYTSASFLDKNAANGKTVNVSGISITGGDADNYNFNTTATTTADITKRALTISATGINKTYDGNRNATVNLTDDRVSGDVFTDSYTSAKFGNKNAGTGKSVSVTGISIAGTDADNYTFNTTATTIADIFKRALTITATGINKTYDGTRDATVTLSDDRVAGDIFADSYTSAKFGNKNAGLGKNVSVTGIDITGVDAKNYTFNTTATTTADIAKRDLTINAAGINKTYDGTRDATVTLTDDRVAGDIFDDTYANAKFGNKNAGLGKNVNVTGIDITGVDAKNYNFNTTATTTADILKRALTIAATGINKTYDGTRDATVTLSDDRVAGDIFDDTYANAKFGNKNAGLGKNVTVTGIDITGVDAKNYTFNTTAATIADVLKRTLTITAAADNKVYDGTRTATVTLSDDRVAGDIFDDTYNKANFGNKNVGTGKNVTVTGIDITGVDAKNYDFNTTTTTTADVTPRTLTISADGISKVYDGTTTADVNLYDDRVAGDDLTSGYTDANFDDRNVGIKKLITVDGITLTGTDAKNYVFNTDTTTGAEITPRGLTVTADGKTKIYGSIDPNLTYSHDVLQTGDTDSIFTGNLTRTAGEHVVTGPYAINQGTLSAGGNYIITYVGSNLIITPAKLNIAANDKSAPYGGTVPKLTYDVAGLVNGDTDAVFSGGLTTVGADSLPGDYSIDQGSLSAGSDYDITYTPGTFTVISPLDQVNTANLQGLFGPLINGGGGNPSALLSLVLSRGGNAGGATGGSLANLETAAGGDDSDNGNGSYNDLETAAGGDEVVSLIDCKKTSFDNKPCEAGE